VYEWGLGISVMFNPALPIKGIMNFKEYRESLRKKHLSPEFTRKLDNQMKLMEYQRDYPTEPIKAAPPVRVNNDALDQLRANITFITNKLNNHLDRKDELKQSPKL
jgi:hypothetical protein